jgi:hypothetical protein
MSTAEVLEKALELLGPNGENWQQGWSGIQGECMVTCISRIVPGDTGNRLRWDAWKFLYPAAGITGCECISAWNDAEGRTWPEVKAAFQKAIELAKQSEARA